MTAHHCAFRIVRFVSVSLFFSGAWVASTSAAAAGVEFPLERTAYFVGELVPVALGEGKSFRLEAKNADGSTLLYEGPSPTVLVDTAHLAAADYELLLNGEDTHQHFSVV